LHGALLDAGLLAEVYIRMTRGQDSLVIESATAAAGGPSAGEGGAADFSGLTLVAVTLTAEELAAHEAVLAELDKASGGKTVWRRLA
jgi:DNA polymerase-3 subunit epsilon